MPRRRNVKKTNPIEEVFVTQWLKTPDILKSQISKMAPDLEKKSKTLQRSIDKWMEENTSIEIDDEKFSGEKMRHIILFAYIFHYVSAISVARPRFFGHLECYNERGEPIIRLVSYI